MECFGMQDGRNFPYADIYGAGKNPNGIDMFADRDPRLYETMVVPRHDLPKGFDYNGDFYNDTFLSDQNACTSPMAVIWTGSKKDIAKKQFWAELSSLVCKNYPLKMIQSIDKLSLFYKSAAVHNEIELIEKKDNFIFRVKVNQINRNLMEDKGNSGYFFELDCDNLENLRDLVDCDSCQTLAYFGKNDEFYDFIINDGLKGVDRIVPIGRTLDFDFIWDGYNLFEEFTRTIAIK